MLLLGCVERVEAERQRRLAAREPRGQHVVERPARRDADTVLHRDVASAGYDFQSGNHQRASDAALVRVSDNVPDMKMTLERAQ